MQEPEGINLYDDKGSCELCSGSIVKHRVPKSEYVHHARAHKAQGDPVYVGYAAGMYRGSDGPNVFRIVTEQQ